MFEKEIMKKLIMSALLGVAVAGTQISAEITPEQKGTEKAPVTVPPATAPTVAPVEHNEVKSQAENPAPKVTSGGCNEVLSSNRTLAAPVFLGTRFVPTGSTAVPLATAQAMISSAGGTVITSSIPTVSITGSGAYTVNQPLLATAPGGVVFNSFAPTSLRPMGYGSYTIQQPTVAAAASGYIMQTPTRVLSPDVHSAYGADYTVYYRGVGSVVLNSPRQYAVGNGQTLVPIYVPTPLAYPAYSGR